MNRRNFVANLGLGLTGACIPGHAVTLLKGGARNTDPAPVDFKVNTNNFQLTLSDAENTVVRLVEKYSIDTQLFGGCIIAKAFSNPAPHINILVNTPDFRTLKSALVSLPVKPILQPLAQTDSIRFIYGGQVFEVQNQRLEVLKQHWLSMRNSGGEELFGHNMLVFNPAKGELIDPFDLLAQDSPKLIMANQPEEKGIALRTVLIGYLECKLLGLQEGEGFSSFSEETLRSSPSRDESREVAVELLNFMPDIVEQVGSDKALAIISTNLCKSAVVETFGTNVHKVAGNYTDALGMFSQAYSPAEIFMALMIGRRANSIPNDSRYSAFGLAQMITPLTKSSRSPRRLDLLSRAIVLSNDSAFQPYI